MLWMLSTNNDVTFVYGRFVSIFFGSTEKGQMMLEKGKQKFQFIHLIVSFLLLPPPCLPIGMAKTLNELIEKELKKRVYKKMS